MKATNRRGRGPGHDPKWWHNLLPDLVIHRIGFVSQFARSHVPRGNVTPAVPRPDRRRGASRSDSRVERGNQMRLSTCPIPRRDGAGSPPNRDRSPHHLSGCSELALFRNSMGGRSRDRGGLPVRRRLDRRWVDWEGFGRRFVAFPKPSGVTWIDRGFGGRRIRADSTSVGTKILCSKGFPTRPRVRLPTRSWRSGPRDNPR
jgi:hypothetical protein